MQVSIRIVHPNSPPSLLDAAGILYLADGGVVILTVGDKLRFWILRYIESGVSPTLLSGTDVIECAYGYVEAGTLPI